MMSIQVVNAFFAVGVKKNDLGIVSPYRAQVECIRERFPLDDELEVSTVDRYQGRDKECIIVSLVRSNDNQEVIQLVQVFHC